MHDTQTDNILQQIDMLVKNNKVVLFMKGTATTPMCGFSGVVAQILNRLNIAFVDVNVLDSDQMRQGIKEYTDWPTIPQLYIDGEFIGGCDIVREMYQNGELAQVLQEKGLLNNPQ
ncbi:MAG: Grx4 family monothiol glutaredoxin [Proteobacteria bacterium]|nr:Grx4 family monothiol glutaredoxin [Pseudomonadota bacterium]